MRLYLYSSLKDKVHKMKHLMEEEIKNNSWRPILEITYEELLKNFLKNSVERHTYSQRAW